MTTVHLEATHLAQISSQDGYAVYDCKLSIKLPRIPRAGDSVAVRDGVYAIILRVKWNWDGSVNLDLGWKKTSHEEVVVTEENGWTVTRRDEKPLTDDEVRGLCYSYGPSYVSPFSKASALR